MKHHLRPVSELGDHKTAVDLRSYSFPGYPIQFLLIFQNQEKPIFSQNYSK